MARKKKVEVNHLSMSEVDTLSEQLGEKIRKICDNAVKKANSILNPYGLNAKMQIAFEDLQHKETSKSSKSKTPQNTKDNL